MIDRPRFSRAVRALCATFRAEATEALLEGYWLGLDDLDVTAFERAARRALRECKFMPTPSELRDFAGRGKDTRPYHIAAPTESRQLLEAIRASWSLVDRAVMPRRQEGGKDTATGTPGATAGIPVKGAR